MRTWNRIKFPLLMGLIALLLVFVRYIALAVPSWVNPSLIYPLLVVRIFSQEWFQTDILMDILLAGIGIWALLLVPVEEENKRFVRRLLRAVIVLVAVFLLSGVAISFNDEWEDAMYQHQQDKTYEAIHAFVDVADAAFIYNNHSQHSAGRFREEFPQLLMMDHGSYYYSDYLFIDYDTQRIGLAYHQYGSLKFFEYQLKPVAAAPDLPQQHAVALSAPGATLFSYCPNQELHQYTTGFALVLADGSVYAITGLRDDNYLFLGLNSELKPIEDFLER